MSTSSNICLQHRLDEPGTETEAIPESSAAGKRKRASSQSTQSAGSRNYNRTAVTLASRPSSIALASSAPGPRPVILKSAFRAPIGVTRREQWTRDPPMIETFFIRTIATINKEGNVEISVSDRVEAIEVARDWEKGQTLYEQNKPHETTGFVGMGYSKRGIYVSFHLHYKKWRFYEHTTIRQDLVGQSTS